MNYAEIVNPSKTPANEPLSGQTKNVGGGYTWEVTKWSRLRRWLILGSEGGTYYVGQKNFTKENVKALEECLQEDHEKTIGEILVGYERAPKKDQAIFALAYAAKVGPNKEKAAAIVYKAALVLLRTSTQMMQFVQQLKTLGGTGSGTRRFIANWYNQKDPDDLAYQFVKYPSRHGFSHRDLLRIGHVMPATDAHDRLYAWVVGKGTDAASEYPTLVGHKKAMEARTPDQWSRLILEYGLTREMLPTEALMHASVWAALLHEMPMTAMIRNLGNMSKAGLLVPMSDAAKLVAERLQDKEVLTKSRIHPFSVLLAWLTYQSGHGFRGGGTWKPVANVLDAAENAFELCFGNVEPTGLRTLIGLDVSSSMMGNMIAGTNISAAVASCALSMIQMHTEPNIEALAFSHGPVWLSGHGITKKTNLSQWVDLSQRIGFGATDCSLPMLFAIKNKMPFDTFVIYTDNENNCGRAHPSQALVSYSKHTGINAKLAVVAMTAGLSGIADPNNPNMLDTVGLDAETPRVVNMFATGDL